MSNDKTIEIDVPKDEIDDDMESVAYVISSWGADLSFRELITMYQEGELIKPEIQRHYVWSKKEASRFIESILLGLPVPSIFLAEFNSQKLIVDGYQRIMSIYDYIARQKFADENKAFKLTDSPIIAKKWRGKSFTELHVDDQRKLKSTTIHAIVFSQQEPTLNYSSLYQIFERINTGGQKLTAQEIRNCIYQCDFNKELIQLNKNPIWRKLLNSPLPNSRMVDIDTILRFFALSQSSVLKSTKSQISLNQIENDFMGKSTNFTDIEISTHSANFIKYITFIEKHFGTSAFFNYSIETQQFTNKMHTAIFDSLMIATQYIVDNNQSKNIPHDIKDRWTNLIKNNELYRTYITERTTLCEHIRGRINIILKEVYNSEHQIKKL